MLFKMKLLQALLIALLCKVSLAAINYDLEAQTYADKASERTFNLYNQIADESYSATDEENFDAIFSKLETIKTIAKEIVDISDEAREFNIDKIQDPNLKQAIKNLQVSGRYFALGEDYFDTFPISMGALETLGTDKDIEPYQGGIILDDGEIAFYPDIQKAIEQSEDAKELKYYWETFREKNSVWASVNFQTIVEGMQKVANISDLNALEMYYSFYNVEEFLKETDAIMEQLKPAYKELHAFIRQELLKKYGKDAVDANGPIPDHLFKQVLAQPWKEGSVIETYFPFKELPAYDGFVQKFDSKKLLEQSEEFYTSLGLTAFDEDIVKNRLKQLDEDESEGDCRSSIFDITPNVYMQYCPQVDFKKFMQMHGYVGRLHCAVERKNLPSYFFDVYGLEFPVGEAVILSASTPKHLQAIGLAKDFSFTEKILMNRLFRMGIHTIMNIPQYYVHAKVMTALLNGTIEMEGANKFYWNLMEEYAGVEPPSDREEGSFDFPHKFYLDLEDNSQTIKLVSEILGYQFYKAFCQKTGEQGQLHNCDFYGNKDVGNAIKSMMSLGSSKEWKVVISKVLGEKTSLNADALLEYYNPILDWVKTLNKQNKVKVGWNESQKKVL